MMLKTYSTRKKPRRIVVQNLPLRRGPNWKRVELLNVSLDLRYTWPRPVRAPQDFVCYIFDSRKIFHQFLRGDSGDIHVHVLVPANQEKSFVHPQWSAAVRQNDHEIRIVNANIIAEHRLRMQISSTRENRSPCMNHDRHAIRLRSFVDRCQAAIAVHIVIGRKSLM